MNNIGKTTLFDVLSWLVRRPWRAASATEASLYSDTDGNHITMLIDEMHYAHLRGRFAAILHAGYRKGHRSAWPGSRLSYTAPLHSVSSAAA